MKKMVLSILVENTAGVLSRISGLFARRGYNIDSLTVSETESNEYSRMTIVCSGEDEVLEQIRKQLSKLVDVKDKIVDVAEDSMMIELTGNQQKLDAFVGLLNGFEIKELVRTGITGLTRGHADMLAGELE